MFKSKKNNQDIEKYKMENAILKHIQEENEKKRQEEDSILDSVKKKKCVFIEQFAGVYDKKLLVLESKELKQISLKCTSNGVLYVRKIGEMLRKEEISLHEKVLGLMLHDLADSLHNLAYEINQPELNNERLRFEVLLILQFIHSYDDLETIQKHNLYVPLETLRNAFPTEFIINSDKRNTK
ncbi:hypothetical protein [Viridibacillus arvi]|uniref:hypothetical protein n=1 Tax=Viridibacillus arvi TaxID=263475 RepID=UPI0034CE531D